MKKWIDKIVSALLIFVVFVGITGFSLAKTFESEKQPKTAAKSQIVREKPKAKVQAKPKKKIGKPKAVSNKNVAASPKAQVRNASFDINPPGNAKLKDGVYYGIGSGFGGTIKVKVVVSGNKISDIQVLSHSETQAPVNYFASGSAVISRIIAAQTPNVDSVSGATFTSNGIKAAVYNAIKDAYEADVPPIIDPAVPDNKQPDDEPKPDDNKDEDKGKENTENKEHIFRGDVIFEGTDYDYDVVVKVEIKDGKIVKVTEHGTRQELDKSKFASINLDFWNLFLDENGFDRFEGKTEAEIKDVDAVTNATATTNGVKQAILKAFEYTKKEAKDKKNSEVNTGN